MVTVSIMKSVTRSGTFFSIILTYADGMSDIRPISSFDFDRLLDAGFQCVSFN